jgi:hypothetical protein
VLPEAGVVGILAENQPARAAYTGQQNHPDKPA